MKIAKIVAGICLITASSVASAGLFGPDPNKLTEDELYAWEAKRDEGPMDSWRVAEGARYAQIYAYLFKKSAQDLGDAGAVATAPADSDGGTSAVASAGAAVAVGSALDLASGTMGLGMINSPGLDGGMLALGLVGVLLGSGDNTVELKYEYQSITLPNKAVRLIRFDDSTNLPGNEAIDAAIARAFTAGRQLVGSSLSEFNCKRWAGSKASTTAAKHERDWHERDFECSSRTNGVRLTAQTIGSRNALSKEPGMLGRTVTSVTVYTPDTDGIVSLIRDKIPEGWYAVYPSEKDGKKVVMVATRDRELAFDPPRNPFIPVQK